MNGLRHDGPTRTRLVARAISRSAGNAGWNQQHAGDPRYADNNGYAYGNDRYHNAGMDYRFSCKINSRGAVTDLNLDRGTRSLRG